MSFAFIAFPVFKECCFPYSEMGSENFKIFLFEIFSAFDDVFDKTDKYDEKKREKKKSFWELDKKEHRNFQNCFKFSFPLGFRSLKSL